MVNPFNKITSFKKLKHLFTNEMTIMYGGFGGIGTPPGLIDVILDSGAENLHLIGNDTGFPDIGIGKVVCAGRAKSIITSHIGSNPVAGQFMTEGKLDIEFSPQGILAERIRAGGVGIPAILSDIGTENLFIAKHKPKVKLENTEYLIETALTADISLVYAKQADSYGNLIYDKSARNTNPLVAMAGEITIAEVEEIVPAGKLHPDQIVTPGVFVDYIVVSEGVNWKWVWE
ncbi:CoA transferase subunit A [Bacillus mesophilum]|uniref:CoA transferase subunit A n=1 Tax=Bacillus mesophilum TaxID=1071718 RepID=A0A7V7RMH7_9BACI|nr:CoA transferase subunit A [Bacillus mesophilum]KAB2333563.1 CoA transferase subunit A [Bacillus mesophilum]